MLITMEGAKAVETMCNLKDWIAKRKIRINIPRNLLQGSARVFMRNFNATTQAWEIIEAIEKEGVKVLNIYMIRNKQTNYFTRLTKVTLLGNNTMNKWLKNEKANLGGVYRQIEREKRHKHATIAKDLDTKSKNVRLENNAGDVEAKNI